MTQRTNKTPAFCDGVISIYEVLDSAKGGDKPRPELAYKVALRYAERTVGIKRFWEAKAYDVVIQRLIRCPRLVTISTQDIAVDADGRQYKIIQIQHPAELPVMDLSLERSEKVYAICASNP